MAKYITLKGATFPTINVIVFLKTSLLLNNVRIIRILHFKHMT